MPGYSGTYKCKNPQKYAGDHTRIVYRSLLERTMMSYFDKHPHVISWSSEETIVPYLSPLDNRVHRYFPDFIVTMLTESGEIEKVMIEVKPESQTKEPVQKITKTGRKSPRYVKEVATYLVNKAKWDYAEKYCEKHGMKFKILTEQTIRPYNGGKSVYANRAKKKKK